jgi:hypothetical protein
MANGATGTLAEDSALQDIVSATDDDPLSYRVISQTTNGTVVMAADGSYTYTPKANFAGTDSFTTRSSGSTRPRAAMRRGRGCWRWACC